MKFTVKVMPEAVQEMAEVFAYYEGVAPGLGERFLDALGRCYSELAANPWREKRKADFRHVVVPRFPYRVVYEVHEEIVLVHQVRHTSRIPHPRFGP
jgi:hypothetical protein